MKPYPHPVLGKAWHPSLCAEGSAPVLGMDIWGDLYLRMAETCGCSATAIFKWTLGTECSPD